VVLTTALFGGGINMAVFEVMARGGTAGGDIEEEVLEPFIMPSLCIVRFPLLLLAHFGPLPILRRFADGLVESEDANVRSSDDLAAQDRGGRAGTLFRPGVMLPAGDGLAPGFFRT